MSAPPTKAPFPYFGGKSTVAPTVWSRFGAIENYCEPFFGSGAVLLQRPQPINGPETVNDADGLLCNFWRAVQHDPEQTAHHADWPVNECDLHARHAWLVGKRDSLQARLEGDPDYYDARIAGWWVWGMSIWIGSEFCSGKGPWQVVDGKLVNTNDTEDDRQDGMGVKRRLLHLSDAGRGVNRSGTDLAEYFRAIADRLRHVRVCCGDWSRVCGPTPTIKHGLTGVFLDPPYSAGIGRDEELYRVESGNVASAVREWAISNGDDPRMRIALCGYEGEHEMPKSWECFAWKAHGGYGTMFKSSDYENKRRERIWFSPHCVDAAMPLFAGVEDDDS